MMMMMMLLLVLLLLMMIMMVDDDDDEEEEELDGMTSRGRDQRSKFPRRHEAVAPSRHYAQKLPFVQLSLGCYNVSGCNHRVTNAFLRRAVPQRFFLTPVCIARMHHRIDPVSGQKSLLHYSERVGFFFVMKELSLQSRALVVNSFPRSKPTPVETQTLLSRPQDPPYF